LPLSRLLLLLLLSLLLLPPLLPPLLLLLRGEWNASSGDSSIRLRTSAQLLSTPTCLMPAFPC
jgi:hypothetical protein